MIENIILKLFLQPLWRITRSQTIGVQGIVVDEQGKVLLVRHRYVRGWYLPGGGVERDECLIDALSRELYEEVGIQIEGDPKLLGLYCNFSRSKGDYIAVYVVRNWHSVKRVLFNIEILDEKFFDASDLPSSTVAGVNRRLEEAFNGLPLNREW